jgi:hypothetical protein
MVAEDSGSGSTASSRPGRCSPSTVRRPCSPTQPICCFARELIDRDKGGRPPDDADLVVRALAFLEDFEAYPLGAYPTADSGCEVSTSSRHLASCPVHRERRATRAARPGAVRADRPGGRTARRERQAAPAYRRATRGDLRGHGGWLRAAPARALNPAGGFFRMEASQLAAPRQSRSAAL